VFITDRLIDRQDKGKPSEDEGIESNIDSE